LIANVFLGVALAGLLLALNARRPMRNALLLIPSFFAAWLVAELATQILLLHLVGVVVFTALAGLGSWQAFAALGISAVTTCLLVDLVRRAYLTRGVLDEVLTEIGCPSTDERPAVSWREFVLPFTLRGRQVKRVRNVAYAEPGTHRYRLDVWHTDDGKDGKPCLLFIPGGAWMAFVTNKEQQGRPLLREMAKSGWVCFAINYPTAPRKKFPAQIVAVKRAIAWIRANAHSYGGDPSFLMASGNSAGGHLSSLAALTGGDPDFQPGFESADTSVQAAVPIYGVYDFAGALQDSELPRSVRRYTRRKLLFLERGVVGRSLRASRELFESLSPMHRAGRQAPPMFLIHGEIDTFAHVEEGRRMAMRLRQVSTEPVAYAEIPGAQHAYDIFLSRRALETVRAISRFGGWVLERWKQQSSGEVSDALDARP
jgi:acetyl esterase/lipase